MTRQKGPRNGADRRPAHGEAQLFVYVGTDRAEGPPLYAGEAFVSARSLRRHTDRPIHLFTNNRTFLARVERRPDFPFTAVHLLDDVRRPKAEKIKAIGALGEEDVVFLDGDTFVFGDLSRVFEFGPFDIAGRVEQSRDGILTMADAVAKEADQRYALNSGVLFVRGAFAPRLSARWLFTYERTVQNRGERVYDQLSLRGALKFLNADVMALPDTYNFRAAFGGLLGGTCFVVHAHSRADLLRLHRADFAPEAVDRLIDHVGRINASPALETLPPVRGALSRADLTRRGRLGPPRLLRAWRALRGA